MRKKYKTLSATRPSAPIMENYRKILVREIHEMARSVDWWIGAEYRKLAPLIAEDAAPETTLTRRLHKIMAKWLTDFEELGNSLAPDFAEKVTAYSTRALKMKLTQAGFTVPFRNTPKVQKLIKKIVADNAALIKSIPRQYSEDVRKLIERSVKSGRDVDFLKNELATRYDITAARARDIARDQSNRATEYIIDARAEELGINRAAWLHVPGLKTSRPTHVEMNGKIYDIKKGLFDKEKGVGKYVIPGELIYCACTKRLVIPEFLG